MWNGGPPNASPNNTLTDDSGDEYEVANIAAVLWYYHTYIERLPPLPKHTSALTEQYGITGPMAHSGSTISKYFEAVLESNTESQDQWQHSGSTISKYFEAVLEAIYNLRHDFATPLNFNIIDLVIAVNGSKYLPWFQNCVGAFDGTHVPCVPPPGNPEVWRNMKGFYSQNVLGVCSFDMKFTYMVAGWEGSAHDARVLTSATETSEKKFPISTVRNVIERTFGVWKARFRILKCINNYPIEKQVQIPIACVVLHNFIHMYNHNDDLLNQYTRNGVPAIEIDPENADQDVNQDHNPDWAMEQNHNSANRRQMNILRDEMATSMWGALEAYRNR
ncbi:uncharacterized protein LOC112094269 [Morus notabilis]|uniref:uncharacterized protein LOC112094269 n=1 Tax=Morus notabilis TaxID=981085 RepID=UPI000CECE8BE|nr:uncharacterized protein LOC112094269 [Morus notabilis]